MKSSNYSLYRTELLTYYKRQNSRCNLQSVLQKLCDCFETRTQMILRCLRDWQILCRARILTSRFCWRGGLLVEREKIPVSHLHAYTIFYYLQYTMTKHRFLDHFWLLHQVKNMLKISRDFLKYMHARLKALSTASTVLQTPIVWVNRHRMSWLPKLTQFFVFW